MGHVWEVLSQWAPGCFTVYCKTCKLMAFKLAGKVEMERACTPIGKQQ